MRRVAFFIFFSALLTSCGSYKQNIMFRPGEHFMPAPIATSALHAERNYLIQKNDYLVLEIYTNNGEKLIDPNPELSQTQQIANTSKTNDQYLVDLNGVAKFPMVGEIKVDGLTLRQAEQLLQKEFEKYYISPFISLKFTNKRVIVLGAPMGQVIPLMNENISLAEVLAMSKGVTNDAKAHNMRLIRGDQVFLIDFSTVEGYQKTNMLVEPGDIIYVEPVRKPLAEGFRDYSILLTFIVTITTLVTLITK